MPQSIRRCLAILNRNYRIYGTSNTDLAARVNAHQNAQMPPGGPLAVKRATVATGVDGSIQASPMQALLNLAKATAIAPNSQIFDWYQHWACLRYLGAFEPLGGSIALSEQAARVRANQRRVLSEELGIGFGIQVAAAWHNAIAGGSAPHVIDLDLALGDPDHWLIRQNWPPIITVGRQPDYLLVDRNTSSRTFRVLSLECKGSADTSTTIGQLARGVTQISSLSLNGTTPQGIVVATVSNGDAIHYRAVDPPSDDTYVAIDNHDWEIAREAPRSSFLQNQEIVAIKASTMARGIRAENGRLALFAGNREAAGNLLPLDLLELATATPRDRVTVENEHGVFRGVSHSFPTAEGPFIQVFRGVDSRVDAAMESGSLDALLDAQDEFKEMHPASGYSPSSASLTEADSSAAVGTDGSIMQINV